jgi:MATE family multidrug resistance protein
VASLANLQELAASAIGSSFVGVMARTVLQGLCGALDTQASQVTD